MDITPQLLRDAAKRLVGTNQSAALDIATKLDRFGSFASLAQRNYAMKLIDVSRSSVTRLHEVMQRHSTFTVGDLILSRVQGDQRVWVKYAGKIVGKLDNGRLILWDAHKEVVPLVEELDADPLAAAMKYGKLSGRCCSCGADLTNPKSIARGIGPECAKKF